MTTTKLPATPLEIIDRIAILVRDTRPPYWVEAELRDICDGLQAKCHHDKERNYIPNGNAGGFSLSITICMNCGKKLTENDL